MRFYHRLSSNLFFTLDSTCKFMQSLERYAPNQINQYFIYFIHDDHYLPLSFPFLVCITQILMFLIKKVVSGMDVVSAIEQVSIILKIFECSIHILDKF